MGRGGSDKLPICRAIPAAAVCAIAQSIAKPYGSADALPRLGLREVRFAAAPANADYQQSAPPFAYSHEPVLLRITNGNNGASAGACDLLQRMLHRATNGSSGSRDMNGSSTTSMCQAGFAAHFAGICRHFCSTSEHSAAASFSQKQYELPGTTICKAGPTALPFGFC